MSGETIFSIKKIAREAGNILLKYRNKELNIETKTDEFDLITQADKESDKLIFSKLQKSFPADKILTEESENTIRNYSGRVWMADPLDGTKHYIAGDDGFSVMIGLCVDGVPQLGVVYAPAREVFYWAEKGKGAYKQVGGDTPIKMQVSNIDVLDEVRLVVRYRRGEKRLTDSFIDGLSVKEKIKESSVGLKLGKIAEGKAEAVFSLNKKAGKWDYCAAEIILSEAGGTLTNLDGNVLDYLVSDQEFKSMTLASNRLVHREMLKAFNDWVIVSNHH